MNDIYKPYTVDELVTMIYEECLDHRFVDENSPLLDCDCLKCKALQLIEEYM